jgi:hypothetical protein
VARRLYKTNGNKMNLDVTQHIRNIRPHSVGKRQDWQTVSFTGHQFRNIECGQSNSLKIEESEPILQPKN